MDTRSNGAPLSELHARFGQSYWYDDLGRELITTGELARMIRDDDLRGVTTNPTIFHHAITGSAAYDDDIAAFGGRGGAEELALELMLADVGAAADVLRRVFDATGGEDGFVSLEMSPRLARDATRTVDLATTLFRRLGRPNVMIKVPGTLEGVDAVEELVRRGVNVNITLLFSVPRYEAVAEAYLRGLERRAGRLDHGSASVASFFLSRIDAKVDPTLPEGSPARGELAIACAKLAHEQFLHRFSGARWRALVARGARPQRLLWASTMPKDAGARPTKYVDALLAPETVCTMPAKLVAAVHELGVVARRPITADLGEARALATRADYEDIAAELVDEGLAKFQASWDALVAALAPRLVRRAG